VRIPAIVSDENAILLDSFASALHPILNHFPGDEETVLIIGAGTIGICAVAALRTLGSRARVLVLARYPFQAELARHYGADEVLLPGDGKDRFQAVAEQTGAKVYQPILSKPVLAGGADTVYECAGTDCSLDDALRLTAAGGKVVLVGAVAVPRNVDWTPIWFHELTVVGSCSVATEDFRGRRMRTYEVGLELMTQANLDLSLLLTHKFRLDEYRRAFDTLAKKGQNCAMKAVFAFD
jgi:threonine dehydrogenase-like Zn-dependent dehydrogenase